VPNELANIIVEKIKRTSLNLHMLVKENMFSNMFECTSHPLRHVLCWLHSMDKTTMLEDEC
jgi:hypothetical protein